MGSGADPEWEEKPAHERKSLDDITPEEWQRIAMAWRQKELAANVQRVDKVDMVNQPPHYTFSKFETIDVLEAWFPKDPLLWQVGKYISRGAHKGRLIEDLEKAAYYLNRRIAQAKKEVRHE